MATAQNVIKNFMSYLDSTSEQGESALNGAVKAVSNFSSWSALKNTMINDLAAYGTDSTGFLKDMCDIILDNDDTGAITGSDAGGGSTKTAQSVVPENGEWRYPSDTTFTIRGLTVTVPDESTLTEKQKFIVGALYSWWIDSALDLAQESFGMSFGSGASVKAIDVKFYNSPSSGAMAYVEYATGKTTDFLHLRINMNYYNNIDISDPNGSASGTITYLDRTIAHEMVHAVMAANVNYFSSLPTIFKEGSAELVHGIDDKRNSNIKSITSSSSNLRSALNSNSANGYAAGYVLLRYLAKQASENRDPSVTPITDTTSETSTTTTTTTTPTTSTTTTTPTTSTTSTTPATSTTTTTPATSTTSTTPATSTTATTPATSTTTTTPATSTTSTTTTAPETTTTSTAATSTTATTTKPTATFSGTTLIVKGAFDKDIWLGGTDIVTGEKNSRYSDPNTITINATAMTAANVLAGNDNNNVIRSGSSGATLWGGTGGSDTLVGGAGSDTFWYTAGSGADVIQSFTSGKDSAGDTLCLIGTELTAMTRTAGTIDFTFADGGTLRLTTAGSVDTAIKYSPTYSNNAHVKVKVGNTNATNNFTYDAFVSYYFGGALQNTLTVADSAEIWLDRDNFSNITCLDASGSSGTNILAGDAAANTILSGSGTASLWGGAGDDILIGGAGQNMFWYGTGDGNDSVQNAKTTDVLNLYSLQLSDITSIETSASELHLGIGESSLQVSGQVPTVKLADGSTWTYNSETDSWLGA